MELLFSYSQGITGFYRLAQVGKPLIISFNDLLANGGANFFRKILPETNRTLIMSSEIQYLDSNQTWSWINKNKNRSEFSFYADRVEQVVEKSGNKLEDYWTHF